MSEEKKTSWGKGYETDAAQEAKPTVPANKPPMNEVPFDENEEAPRARNQHVLPGILGRQLRAAYGELLNAPIPDTISDLVRRLETSEAKPSPEKSEDEESGQ